MLNKKFLDFFIFFFLGISLGYALTGYIAFKLRSESSALFIKKEVFFPEHIFNIKKDIQKIQYILKGNIFEARKKSSTHKAIISEIAHKNLVSEINGYKLIGYVEDKKNPIALFKKQKEPISIVDKNSPLEEVWFLKSIKNGVVILKNKKTGEIKSFSIKDEKLSQIEFFPKQERKEKSKIEKFKIAKSKVEKAFEDPNKFIRNIRIAPYFKNGKAIGYRLVYINPSSILKQLGFKSGDIIININGRPTNDPSNLAEMFNQLKDFENVSVDIIRNNKKKTIFIEID